jgi:hypothetical protein
MKLGRDCVFSGVGDLATGLGDDGRVSSPGAWVVGRTLVDILRRVSIEDAWSNDKSRVDSKSERSTTNGK